MEPGLAVEELAGEAQGVGDSGAGGERRLPPERVLRPVPDEGLGGVGQLLRRAELVGMDVGDVSALPFTPYRPVRRPDR